MRVGAAIVMQNLGRAKADADVYRDEIALGDLVEPLGFDSLYCTEHHFSDYMIVPEIFQILTFFAARTQRVLLGAGVKVLPWANPVRIAEQVAMLDLLSQGRLQLG